MAEQVLDMWSFKKIHRKISVPGVLRKNIMRMSAGLNINCVITVVGGVKEGRIRSCANGTDR